MFKKILLAAAVAATASFAQVSFGTHLGLGLSTLSGDDAEDATTGFSFQAGGAANITVPVLPFTIAPELMIDMRNYGYESGSEFNISSWVLDIPVLVRFTPMPVFFIEAGPQFSFNLSTSSDEILGKDINDLFDINTFEFDLVFGAGTGMVPFVDLDFRIVLGMTQWMSEIKGMKGSDPLDMSNLQFMLGATYWF